jgi:hypothetical protein
MLKVGTKVRVVTEEEHWEHLIGCTGTIVGVAGDIYRVDFGDYCEFMFSYKLEEVKRMTKDELKNYQLVQFRNKKWYVVFLGAGYKAVFGNYKDLLVQYNGTYKCDLDTHNDDLTYKDSNLDIIKVATVDNFADVLKGISRTDCTPVEELDGFTVLWQRENPEVTRQKELVDKLQKQLAEAQSTLKEMMQL